MHPEKVITFPVISTHIHNAFPVIFHIQPRFQSVVRAYDLSKFMSMTWK